MRPARHHRPAAIAIGGSLIAFACSLTVPSEDQLFGSGTSGPPEGGTAGTQGGTPNTQGGTAGLLSSGGSGGTAGQAALMSGGAGGDAETVAPEGGQDGDGGMAGAPAAGEPSTEGGAAGAPLGEAGMGGEPPLGEAGAGPGPGGSGGEGGGEPIEPFEPELGLTTHYRFDETEGTVVTDDAGNADATVQDAEAEWVEEGKIGGALRLSGKSGYVDFPPSTFSSLEEMTMAVWFNRGSQQIWTRVFDIGSSRTHWMYFSPHAVTNLEGPGTHAALDIANQITVELHDVDFVPAVSTWTHVAIVWNRDYFAYYVNGELTAEDTSPIYNPAEFAAAHPSGETMRGWLGRSSFEPEDDDKYFVGMFDDFRIYDRVLSPEHVRALYELTEESEE